MSEKELLKYSKIIKEYCIWEYNYTPKDIYEILNGNDFEKRAWLYQKMVKNLPYEYYKMYQSDLIFSKDEIKKFLETNALKYENQKRDYEKLRVATINAIFLNKLIKVEGYYDRLL